MLRTSTSPPSMQKALRRGSDFEFDSGDKNGYRTYVLQLCFCAIIISLYFQTLFSRHPAKTTRTTRHPLDNLPKGKDLSVFFAGNPNLHLYTANTVSRYRYSDTSGHRPDLWHHRLGIGNVHFPGVLRHCFLFNTVRRPRPPSPNDNTLSEIHKCDQTLKIK